MPMPLRRLIVCGEEPASVSAAAVVHALRLPLSQFRSAARALVAPTDDVLLRVPELLNTAECEVIRRALDAGVNTNQDSVDGLPDYQLDMHSVAELEELIGTAAVQRLQRLPQLFCASQRRAAAMCDAVPPEQEQKQWHQATPAQPATALGIWQMFARRYTKHERPWFGFHRDKGPLTVNVACSSDAYHEGGKLLGLLNGRVEVIHREEGEAIVHPSTLLHGVSRMEGGVRYSLIIFYREVSK